MKQKKIDKDQRILPLSRKTLRKEVGTYIFPGNVNPTSLTQSTN